MKSIVLIKGNDISGQSHQNFFSLCSTCTYYMYGWNIHSGLRLLLRISCDHRDHTILLNRKRVNKGMTRTKRFTFVTCCYFLCDLTGKTTTYKSCIRIRLILEPFCALQKFFWKCAQISKFQCFHEA